MATFQVRRRGDARGPLPIGSLASLKSIAIRVCGLGIAKRRGLRRTAVAVSRELAVLMHRYLGRWHEISLAASGGARSRAITAGGN